ncbi:YdcF family protein [[Mycobacterium] burgundiense]|uniref:YdcF family protein n=1 Tax=[Mycobacterium] burgundiense TaxID=3064286 RepID=A0ABM9LE13_9MYCO|nr:YdcF family protein [Mycolicibacterium sp. MU0053]CAJ1497429.1 YdcF family protein [Mycolicibacterium sp. MU0053]
MRRVAAALLSLAVLVGAVAAAGYPVFVAPQVDKPRPADAILVVGGDAPQTRYRAGLALARQGYAPHLVLSNPAGQVDQYCDSDGPGFSVECFEPVPPSTQGEARELGRLASERGWRTVIVVTYTPHVSRARYIMSQCFDGELVMVGVPTRLSVPYWAWMYVYQGAGFVKALAQRGC